MTLRWRIRGSFTTTAPMHVGSGANTKHSSIIDQNKAPCDVAAVVMDYQGHPCIPGTALKGVLRAWAEQFFPDESAAIVRIFGHRNVTAPTAESGWAEFTTAFIRTLTQADREQFEKRVPYWQPDRCTGIFSNVCISRKTGAAQANKLFYQEFVPEGVSFEVEIAATRLTDEEITLLLAVLEHGASHPTHAYQFGANGADGWGRVAWSLDSVNQGSPSQGPGPAPGAVGFDSCTTPWQPEGVEHACTCRGSGACFGRADAEFSGAVPGQRRVSSENLRHGRRREGRPHELHATAQGHRRRMAAILVLSRCPARAHRVPASLPG